MLATARELDEHCGWGPRAVASTRPYPKVLFFRKIEADIDFVNYLSFWLDKKRFPGYSFIIEPSNVLYVH